MGAYGHSAYGHNHVPRDRAARREFRSAVHDQLLSLPMLLAAVALVLGPMVSQAGPKDAQMNELIVGIALLFVVGRRLYRGSSARSDLVVGGLGAWMIAAPFLLGLQNTAIAEGNKILDVTAGIVLVLAAAASLMTIRGNRDQQRPEHARTTR
ncbi:SPW repeat domain-containing protein [Streptomyces lateritius]|uniref:SPW repeat domain-containing protein n=1 Tax=Streptomyces lateritius TaxID=67313 RepID=UPI00167BE795|nr:hypothetical protein [Streptomyces lateritius]GGT72171.1 hypothetical protein GCM10010272_14110 [Streptomyces lateritius]